MKQTDVISAKVTRNMLHIQGININTDTIKHTELTHYEKYSEISIIAISNGSKKVHKFVVQYKPFYMQIDWLLWLLNRDLLELKLRHNRYQKAEVQRHIENALSRTQREMK